jgi:cytochrome c551/c552
VLSVTSNSDRKVEIDVLELEGPIAKPPSARALPLARSSVVRMSESCVACHHPGHPAVSTNGPSPAAVSSWVYDP